MELLGITIFCDDIRFEHNGKITLVGCYGPEMLISDPLPVVLPRLGMLVQLRMPAGSSSPSQILVYMPDLKMISQQSYLKLALQTLIILKEASSRRAPTLSRY